MTDKVQEARPNLYFVNGPIDFLFVGGLSILLYFIFKLAGDRIAYLSMAILAGRLTWVVNWPHFSATSYRLYGSRQALGQYPCTAILAPLIASLGVLGSFVFPQVVAPYFVKFYLLWSSYHFSGQTVGFSMIYSRRAGFHIGKWERLALSGFIFGTFIMNAAAGDSFVGGAAYYGISYPGLGLPPWFVSLCKFWMWTSGAVFLGFASIWSFRRRRLVPLVVLLPALTQFVWFVLGSSVSTFQSFVPFFHSLQYLLIAWMVEVHRQFAEKGEALAVPFVWKRSLRWGVINFIGGAFLFYFLPRVFGASDQSSSFAMGVVIAGVQVHHFLVDGVIWKLRDHSVSSPLTVNIKEMLA